jgi:hypothetical protein
MALRDLHQSYKPGDVSEEDIRTELVQMEEDPKLDTRVSLEKEEGMTLHLMTFQEKHVTFLMKHPKIDPVGYLTNLRTMIKIRK